MITNKTYPNIFGSVVFSIVVLVAVYLFSQNNIAIGSVAEGQGYYATTTDATWTGAKVIRTGSGMLGSVVVTNATAGGVIKVYNATTTNIALRNNKATSTIVIADISSTATAGTYTFDANFTDGLIVDIGLGVNVASSTVTFK